MTKKIFDILPPSSEPVVRAKKEKVKKASFKPDKKILIGTTVLLLVSFLVYQLFFFKIQIDLHPQSESVSVEKYFEVVSLENLKENMILGHALESFGEKTQTFSASGKALKEERAGGVITVYNNYSTSPQTFIENTRFLSSEGRQFRSLERAVVPGGSYERGKLIPGKIDIKVRAEESGEDYNIGPSSFSVPGLAGTALYTSFYGESTLPMTGGEKKEMSQVTEQDLENAKELLLTSLLTEGVSDIKNKAKKDLFFFDDKQFRQDIIDSSSSAKAGDLADQFVLTISAKTTALSFEGSDFEKVAEREVLSFLPESDKNDLWVGRKIYPQTLKIDYEIETINRELTEMSVGASISSRVYWEIDQTILKAKISGMSRKQALEFIEVNTSTKTSNIRAGIWASKILQNPERIKININFSDKKLD